MTAAPKRILVVDDEDVVRRTLLVSLGKNSSYELECAQDGQEAIQKLEESFFHLVITDLSMPNMDGIQLLRHIKRDYPNLPVVIFTGYGTLDDAIEALRLGAINFLRKPFDLGQIRLTVERVFAMDAKVEERREAFSFSQQTTQTFRMPARMHHKQGIITLLTENLVDRGICDQADVRNVFMALDELLSNAIIYGCMGVDGNIHGQPDGDRKLDEALQTWLSDPPDPLPEIEIQAVYRPGTVEYTITDPGPGFDYEDMLDAEDPENLMREHGRGLILVQCFMDDVVFTAPGNRVTVTKRASADADHTPD